MSLAVLAQSELPRYAHLAMLIAGLAIPPLLWWFGPLRPAALKRPSGSAAKHPSAVWILCGLALWCVQQISGTLAASMPQDWLGPPDQPRARALVSLAMYALSVPTALALLMGLASAKGGAGAAPDLIPRPRDSWRGPLALLFAAPTLYAVAFAAVWITTRLTGSAPDPIAHNALKAIADGASSADPWAWLLIAAVTLGAPVVEESIYRALLQTGLLRATGRPVLAIALASAAFTAVHVGAVPPHGLPVIAALALALGIAYERTGSIIVPISMHAGFNAANIALALLAV